MVNIYGIATSVPKRLEGFLGSSKESVRSVVKRSRLKGTAGWATSVNLQSATFAFGVPGDIWLQTPHF
jgi:hypothetical protein